MRVLWIPIFSMRSYQTGKYSILKDGNFQLTMARVLASDFEHIDVCVPNDSADYFEACDRFSTDRVELTMMEYGMNAVSTRKLFWRLNSDELPFISDEYDLVVSDITGYPGDVPVIYNFNITKLPELDRPYIDSFFEQDLKSIEQSLFTTVLNPRQRQYILECRPDLLDKIIVNTKCAHVEMLPLYTIQLASAKTIFWPFRLSDKSYQWEKFLNTFVEHGADVAGYNVVITDPNDSIQELPEFVSKITPSKDEYYRILSSRPIVVMLDDIDTVLHPGTIEFFYYNCPVITMKSELIQNPNAIEYLDDVVFAIRHLEYNASDSIGRFVYAENELDHYYNEGFVNVRKN